MNLRVIKSGVTLDCRSIRRRLKKGHHDSSDTELGVLTVITSHAPIPPERGMFRHRCRETQLPPILYPQEQRKPYLFGGNFSSTYSWCHRN
ncbi:hypothetical protein AVEN_110813-1 [Araneus ventricosus]|uniref:Uncharacterized protein n=1 Tax=Araneus ventricosus TaxID=182803 RepID=A0A4Y2GCP3_ARAVE|nr:hypothetical protein AVEN_110813-1 [Araneus ventricosus]